MDIKKSIFWIKQVELFKWLSVQRRLPMRSGAGEKKNSFFGTLTLLPKERVDRTKKNVRHKSQLPINHRRWCFQGLAPKPKAWLPPPDFHAGSRTTYWLPVSCPPFPAGSESCSSVGSSSSSLSRPHLPLPPPPPTWSTVPSLPLIGPMQPPPTDAVKTVLPSPQQQPPNQEVANYYVLPLEASGILVGPHAGEQAPRDWFLCLRWGGAKRWDNQ